MSEIYEKDDSIHEPSTAHHHPRETIPQGSQADAVEIGHEHRDVSFGAIGMWFGGLFIFLAFSFLAMWGYFVMVDRWASRDDGVPSALFAERERIRRVWPDPPVKTPLQSPSAVPALLPDPEKPMAELRAREDKALTEYNWRKDARGRTVGVTIPIERALELTAQRGFPYKTTTTIRPPLADDTWTSSGAAPRDFATQVNE